MVDLQGAISGGLQDIIVVAAVWNYDVLVKTKQK